MLTQAGLGVDDALAPSRDFSQQCLGTLSDALLLKSLDLQTQPAPPLPYFPGQGLLLPMAQFSLYLLELLALFVQQALLLRQRLQLLLNGLALCPDELIVSLDHGLEPDAFVLCEG